METDIEFLQLVLHAFKTEPKRTISIGIDEDNQVRFELSGVVYVRPTLRQCIEAMKKGYAELYLRKLIEGDKKNS